MVPPKSRVILVSFYSKCPFSFFFFFDFLYSKMAACDYMSICLTCLHIYLYDVVEYEWCTISHDDVGYMRFLISCEITFGMKIYVSVLLVVVSIAEIFSVL